MKKTIVCIILITCILSCNSNKKVNVQGKKDSSIKIILNDELIDEFYRDDRLRPDNPDFIFEKVVDFKIDLDNNQRLDTIVLLNLIGKGWDTDPGDYRQIKIKMDNGYTWEETNFGGWVRFDHNYPIPEKIKKINELDTDLLIVIDFYNTKVVGLFGWVYASEPGLMTFIDFSSGQPRLMINRKLFLKELTHDNIMVSKIYEDTCSIKVINEILEMNCN